MFFEDPILVQNVGLSLVRSAEEKDVTHGREKQLYAVETFSKLLELVTIRHRLLESASETAHLAQLRKHSHQAKRVFTLDSTVTDKQHKTENTK